jgi:hypothetical protein
MIFHTSVSQRFYGSLRSKPLACYTDDVAENTDALIFLIPPTGEAYTVCYVKWR